MAGTKKSLAAWLTDRLLEGDKELSSRNKDYILNVTVNVLKESKISNEVIEDTNIDAIISHYIDAPFIAKWRQAINRKTYASDIKLIEGRLQEKFLEKIPSVYSASIVTDKLNEFAGAKELVQAFSVADDKYMIDFDLDKMDEVEKNILNLIVKPQLEIKGITDPIPDDKKAEVEGLRNKAQEQYTKAVNNYLSENTLKRIRENLIGFHLQFLYSAFAPLIREQLVAAKLDNNVDVHNKYTKWLDDVKKGAPLGDYSTEELKKFEEIAKYADPDNTKLIEDIKTYISSNYQDVVFSSAEKIIKSITSDGNKYNVKFSEASTGDASVKFKLVDWMTIVNNIWIELRNKNKLLKDKSLEAPFENLTTTKEYQNAIMDLLANDRKYNLVVPFVENNILGNEDTQKVIENEFNNTKTSAILTHFENVWNKIKKDKESIKDTDSAISAYFIDEKDSHYLKDHVLNFVNLYPDAFNLKSETLEDDIERIMRPYSEILFEESQAKGDKIGLNKNSQDQLNLVMDMLAAQNKAFAGFDQTIKNLSKENLNPDITASKKASNNSDIRVIDVTKCITLQNNIEDLNGLGDAAYDELFISLKVDKSRDKYENLKHGMFNYANAEKFNLANGTNINIDADKNRIAELERGIDDSEPNKYSLVLKAFFKGTTDEKVRDYYLSSLETKPRRALIRSVTNRISLYDSLADGMDKDLRKILGQYNTLSRARMLLGARTKKKLIDERIQGYLKNTDDLEKILGHKVDDPANLSDEDDNKLKNYAIKGVEEDLEKIARILAEQLKVDVKDLTDPKRKGGKKDTKDKEGDKGDGKPEDEKDEEKEDEDEGSSDKEKLSENVAENLENDKDFVYVKPLTHKELYNAGLALIRNNRKKLAEQKELTRAKEKYYSKLWSLNEENETSDTEDEDTKTYTEEAKKNRYTLLKKTKFTKANTIDFLKEFYKYFDHAGIHYNNIRDNIIGIFGADAFRKFDDDKLIRRYIGMLLETLKVDNLEELKSEVGGLEDCFVKLAEPEEKLVAEVLESDLEVIRTALDNLIKFKEKDNKPYSAEFIAKERVVDDRGHKEKYIDVEFYDEENKVLSVNPLDKLSGGAKIYGKLAAITYVTPSGSKYVVYRLLDKDGKAIDTSSIAQESLSKFKKDNYTQILALMLEHKYPVKEKSEIAKDTDGKEMITTETITEDNMMVKTFLDYINKYKETRYDDSLQTAVLAYDELEKSVHGTLTVHLDPSGNVVVEAFDISDNLLSDIVGSLKSDINNEVKPAPRKDDDLAAFKLTLDGEFIQDYMMLAKPVKKDELLSIINNLCYRQCYGCIRLDKDGKLDFVTRKDKEFKDEMKLIENEENLYRDVFAKILEGVTITDDMRDKLREICTLSINNKLIKDFLASIAQHAQKGENLDDVKKIVTDWLNSDNKLLAGLKLEQEWQKKLEDEKGRG